MKVLHFNFVSDALLLTDFTSFANYFRFSEYCNMTTNVPPDTTLWIEKDGIDGPTDGDTIVHVGDQIGTNETVQIGNCQQW